MKVTIYKQNKTTLVSRDHFGIYHEPFPGGITDELNFKVEWPTTNSDDSELSIEVRLTNDLYSFEILEYQDIEYSAESISLTVSFGERRAWVPFKLKETEADPGLPAGISITISDSTGNLEEQPLALQK